MLTGPGLGDDAPLSHTLGQERLAEAVINLVRTRVVEVLALEIDASPTQVLGQTPSESQGARTPGILGQLAVELGGECGVRHGLVIGALQLEKQRHQGLGDEAAAENAVAPALVRSPAVGIQCFHVWMARSARLHCPITAPSKREWPPLSRRRTARPADCHSCAAASRKA